jgi:hypothetical protein
MIRYCEGGINPAIFATLTDAQIFSVYWRQRDPDGKLYRRTKKPSSAGPAPLDGLVLEIPDEAYRLWPEAEPAFVSLFWSVWRLRHRKSAEETLERWRAYVEREVYKGRRRQAVK